MPTGRKTSTQTQSLTIIGIGSFFVHVFYVGHSPRCMGVNACGELFHFAAQMVCHRFKQLMDSIQNLFSVVRLQIPAGGESTHPYPSPIHPLALGVPPWIVIPTASGCRWPSFTANSPKPQHVKNDPTKTTRLCGIKRNAFLWLGQLKYSLSPCTKGIFRFVEK